MAGIDNVKWRTRAGDLASELTGRPDMGQIRSMGLYESCEGIRLISRGYNYKYTDAGLRLYVRICTGQLPTAQIDRKPPIPPG
jgi:hypothetical protein